MRVSIETGLFHIAKELIRLMTRSNVRENYDKNNQYQSWDSEQEWVCECVCVRGRNKKAKRQRCERCVREEGRDREKEKARDGLSLSPEIQSERWYLTFSSWRSLILSLSLSLSLPLCQYSTLRRAWLRYVSFSWKDIFQWFEISILKSRWWYEMLFPFPNFHHFLCFFLRFWACSSTPGQNFFFYVSELSLQKLYQFFGTKNCATYTFFEEHLPDGIKSRSASDTSGFCLPRIVLRYLGSVPKGF